MRAVEGEIISTAKFHFPAAGIISGSSGSGKTSFAFQLIKHQHFTKRIKHVYYFGCTLGEELDWHNMLEEVTVTYASGLPTAKFFETVRKRSIIIIDDQYEDAVREPEIARAFKVYRRHNNFSIFLITQVV